MFSNPLKTLIYEKYFIVKLIKEIYEKTILKILEWM